jgi:hypothetical protein
METATPEAPNYRDDQYIRGSAMANRSVIAGYVSPYEAGSYR